MLTLTRDYEAKFVIYWKDDLLPTTTDDYVNGLKKPTPTRYGNFSLMHPALRKSMLKRFLQGNGRDGNDDDIGVTNDDVT